MGISDLAGPFGEWRAATTSGGTAITAGVTAAAAFVALPPGTAYVALEPRNFSTAVVLRFAQNPYLTVLKTTDSLAVSANTTDYSTEAQDGNATTVVTLSSLATTGHLWVGAALPFRGVFADVSAANGTTNTAAALYYDGSTMAALTITDGTDSGGVSLAVDGGITWTVPTDWAAGTLRTIAAAAVGVPASGTPLYWVRFQWNAAHDSATTLSSLFAMNRSSTAYAEVTSGRGAEFVMPTGAGRIGCIEARTDAGTANLIVNVATIAGGRFQVV